MSAEAGISVENEQGENVTASISQKDDMLIELKLMARMGVASAQLLDYSEPWSLTPLFPSISSSTKHRLMERNARHCFCDISVLLGMNFVPGGLVNRSEGHRLHAALQQLRSVLSAARQTI